MSEKPILMMTDAGHYEVSYVINPWMTPAAWAENRAGYQAEAQSGSLALKAALEGAGAEVRMIDAVPGLPDLVFPANAAVVLDRKAIVARFSCAERQGEEAVFLEAFQRLQREGLFDAVTIFPDGIYQEGAGDCIWDKTRGHFWAGYGQRSLHAAIPEIEDFFGEDVVALELISPRYYHLDVCFLPLSGGEIVYYPPAFSEAAKAAIRDIVPAGMLIEARDEDAAAFSVNAVNIGRNIVMARPPERLQSILEERGYRVSPVDLAPFIMSGGGAYCMTLRLNRASEHAARRAQHPASASA